MVTEVPSAAVPFGDQFTVTVKAEKLPFIKEGHGGRKRLFVCLANADSGQLQVKEVKASEQLVTQKFTVLP